jgi:DNA-binding NarL/FixJ family response regulator
MRKFRAKGNVNGRSRELQIVISLVAAQSFAIHKSPFTICVQPCSSVVNENLIVNKTQHGTNSKSPVNARDLSHLRHKALQVCIVFDIPGESSRHGTTIALISSMNANAEWVETKDETKLNDVTERKAIRLWLVDDSDLLREVLAENFAHEKSIESVRQFSSAESAIESLLTDAPPDVILLDRNMRGMSGIEALPAIKHLAPHTRVLIFTTFYDSHAALAAFRAGASGFLLKSYEFKRICDCIADAKEAWPQAWFKTRSAELSENSQPKNCGAIPFAQPGKSREVPVVSLLHQLLGFLRRHTTQLKT